MNAGPEAVQAASNETAKRLAKALRDAVSHCAAQVSGGIAAVFTTSSGESPRLRSAAGFASPEVAREGAQALLPIVEKTVESKQTQDCDSVPQLGSAASGGLVVLPVLMDGRIYGALAVSSPAPLRETQLGVFSAIADSIAVHIDHAMLEAEAATLRGQLSQGADSSDSQSDELLKLSEALFAQDIELLRKNEKLGKIEKLKDDFIEKMSSELRTPLNSIIEAIISVLSGENDVISEGAKSSLRTALDDGTAFLRTLQNILDLWRIKQRELPVEIQNLNFREVIEEAIFSIRESLDDKPIKIEKRFDEPFPKIRTDVAKINQILFLLLDNAVKFTERGSIEIYARIEKGHLVCEVRDTGIGICPDDQQFVFDEFYQVDELSSTRYRGAGLGLALARDLLVLLEGELSLSSEVGRGTTMTLRIPVQTIS